MWPPLRFPSVVRTGLSHQEDFFLIRDPEGCLPPAECPRLPAHPLLPALPTQPGCTRRFSQVEHPLQMGHCH